MTNTLRLGISPCPNDTFMFYALLKGKVQAPCNLDPVIRDVEELNEMVARGELQVSKVSYHLAGLVQDQYKILPVGSALGWGCGPLVVVDETRPFEGLAGRRVAVPGKFTTAHMLLRLYEPQVGETIPMLFSKIPGAVKGGEVEAGVIIHESRFTYRDLGLKAVVDLGEWWEKGFGLPIPLGGIIYKRELDGEIAEGLASSLRESISYAWSHIDEVIPFMKQWAQELDESVILSHVRLYVNDFSMDLGELGRKAVDFLFRLGIERGLFPERDRDT